MVEFLKSVGITGTPEAGLFPVMLLFLVAAISSFVFMPRIRQYAIRVGTADQPNERRLNKEPLPNIGGLAIYIGVVVALVLAIALKGAILKTVQVQVLAIMLGATMMLMVGFIDDQFGLSPLLRLGAQVLAAGLLVVNGIRFDFSGGPLNQVWLETALTIFWIVGITNATNLMDGIDGLVGGLGFIASACLLAISAQFPDRAAATLILAALAGGCLGFLYHNFNPSRIIMGDGGAYFIGYTLAAVSTLGTLKIVAGASLVAPLLFLAVPILDMTQVVVRRLQRGVNPLSTPGKDHAHHLLLKLGLGPRRTVTLLWTLILLANIVGMALQHARPMVIVVTALGIVACLSLVSLPRVRQANIERRKQTQS